MKLHGRIPDGFPVSVPEGARPTAVLEPLGASPRERLVLLESSDDVLPSIRFYQADLLDRGYDVERLEEVEAEISTTILHGVRGADSVHVAVKRRIDGSRGTTIRVTWAGAEHP